MPRTLLPLALLVLPVLVGCGSAQQTQVTVFAAASTAAALGKEIAAFETAHQGIRVQGDYEGTQSLLVKLEAEPASADVFLSADVAHMGTAVSRKLVRAPLPLAGNRLVIAVPADNPAHITSLADLARPHLRVVLADPSVPAGRYAEQTLQNVEASGLAPAPFAHAVAANVVSRESDVEQVVSKIAAGEADAGIVYATDAVTGARIHAIAIPAAVQPRTEYRVAVTADAREPGAANEFVRFLLSAEGQNILRQAGFVVPVPP